MLEDRVRHHDVGQDIAILYQVDLVECKVVVNDKYFIDGLGYCSNIPAHLVVSCHDPVGLLMTGCGAQFQLESAVGIRFAQRTGPKAAWHVLPLVLLV